MVTLRKTKKGGGVVREWELKPDDETEPKEQEKKDDKTQEELGIIAKPNKQEKKDDKIQGELGVIAEPNKIEEKDDKTQEETTNNPTIAQMESFSANAAVKKVESFLSWHPHRFQLHVELYEKLQSKQLMTDEPMFLLHPSPG